MDGANKAEVGKAENEEPSSARETSPEEPSLGVGTQSADDESETADGEPSRPITITTTVQVNHSPEDGSSSQAQLAVPGTSSVGGRGYSRGASTSLTRLNRRRFRRTEDLRRALAEQNLIQAAGAALRGGTWPGIATVSEEVPLVVRHQLEMRIQGPQDNLVGATNRLSEQQAWGGNDQRMPPISETPSPPCRRSSQCCTCNCTNAAIAIQCCFFCCIMFGACIVCGVMWWRSLPDPPSIQLFDIPKRT